MDNRDKLRKALRGLYDVKLPDRKLDEVLVLLGVEPTKDEWDDRIQTILFENAGMDFCGDNDCQHYQQFLLAVKQLKELMVEVENSALMDLR